MLNLFKATTKVRLILNGKTYHTNTQVLLTEDEVNRLQTYIKDVEKVKENTEEKEKEEVKPKRASTKGKAKKDD